MKPNPPNRAEERIFVRKMRTQVPGGQNSAGARFCPALQIHPTLGLQDAKLQGQRCAGRNERTGLSLWVLRCLVSVRTEPRRKGTDSGTTVETCGKDVSRTRGLAPATQLPPSFPRKQNLPDEASGMHTTPPLSRLSSGNHL